MIKQEANKATTMGFLTGLGGLISLPITLPASAIGALFIQMRLVATIALLQGHDIYDKRIQLLMYFSLCVMSGKSELQRFCLKTLMKQSNEIIQQINLSVTKQLIVILSTKNSLKLVKVIPLVSGMTSAIIDRFITYRIGQFAKHQFNQSY